MNGNKRIKAKTPNSSLKLNRKEETMGKNSKKKRRARKLTRHHDVNRVNGGKDTPGNIIKLRNRKHEIWHQIFHNLSFVESAKLLIRTYNLKHKDEDVYYEIVKRHRGSYNLHFED